MWATIIIAASFTRIMGSTAGNVYRTIVAVVSCSITLWILVGGDFLWGAGRPPAGAVSRVIRYGWNVACRMHDDYGDKVKTKTKIWRTEYEKLLIRPTGV